MNKNANFQSHDLYFSAYLYSQNIKLLEIYKDNTNSFSWFSFEDTELCLELEKKFWSKDAIVEITSYLSALKTLKQRLFQDYPKGG